MANESPDMMSKSMTSGLLIYAAAFIFCSMESVPGWGGLDLDLPPWVWVVAMAGVGAVSGALILEKRRPIGAVGGLIAGIGAMLFVIGMMQKSNEVRAAALVLAGVIGSLPGIGVAGLWNWILEFRSKQKLSKQTDDGDTRVS